MRSPAEFIGDLYDYQYQYYRWFLHRRVLFSDTKIEDFKNFASYDIFREDDRENVGQLVTETTMLGAAGGLSLGSAKYVIDTTARGVQAAKASRMAFGVILVGTAIGVGYGSILNMVSNYRNKNEATNHAIAAIATFPITGVYAKTLKIKYGVFNGLIAAAVLAGFKGAKNGEFMPIKASHLERNKHEFKKGDLSTHWNPR